VRTEAPPRLVGRSIVASLLAFLVVGTAVAFAFEGIVRHRAEREATFHAVFTAGAVLEPLLEGVDLSRPLTGEDFQRVDEAVRTRILTDGRDVRVKLWDVQGTVLYADAPELIGRRFPEEAEELREVFEGETPSGISDLDDDENVAERPIADKLFFTYVPVEVDGTTVAVFEMYQRYAVIQGDVSALLRTIAITFGVGLIVLYALLLPIASRASSALRRQNVKLNELLEREQETVAELRDLDQKKSDFVAAASHELRTPLTAILGYLQTMRLPEVSADTGARDEFIRASEDQTRRLFRLITNLLSASHLEAGSRPTVLEQVDLVQLIGSITPELPNGSDRVRVDIPAGTTVVADRWRLEQVLTNVLDNALKYSPGGSRVEVDASVEGPSVSIRVRDRGIGVHPDHHDAIFERFHQVDQSSTRRHGGLGLGLHLARELSREAGGDIAIESTPGAGSVFTITFPAGAPELHEASVGSAGGTVTPPTT
jgi:signal transduction histidine kinase